MKKRKTAQVLIALALAATMTAQVTAFATDITPGDKTTVTDMTDQNGTTPIKLDVSAGYIVTIPAEINLVEGESEESDGTGTNGDEIYTGKGTISVEDVHLEYGKQLKVSVSEETSFELKDDDDSIQYEVATTEGGEALKGGSQIVVFSSEEGPDDGDSQEVYFKTSEPVTDAGNFTGNITFTFSVIGD